MLKPPEKLWMYMDYKTGRMLVLGPKEEVEEYAMADFKFITKAMQMSGKYNKEKDTNV